MNFFSTAFQQLVALILFVYRTLVDIINNRTRQAQDAELPQKIGEYTYDRTLPKAWEQDTGIQGIYIGPDGSKAFAKMITYRIKGTAYRKFKNEVYAYSILNNIQPQKDLKIPKLLTFVEGQGKMIILLEFIDGQSGNNMNNNQKISAYKNFIRYIEDNSNDLSSKKIKHLPQRTGIHFVLMYPIFFILALIRHPETYKEILNGSVIFFMNCHTLLNHQQLIFSHRDLHFKNFIIKNGQTYLVDFDSAGFTLEMYDAIITLWHEWGNEQFTKDLIALLEQRGMENIRFEKQFKFLATYVCTQALTANNYSEYDIHQIRDFFRYVLNYSNFQNKQPFFFYLRRVVLNFLYKLAKPMNTKFTSALCFHSISNDNNRYSIDEKQFEKILLKISENSTFVDVETSLSNRGQSNSSVLVTFDDGYKDIFKIIPYVQKFNVKPLLFVLSDPENADVIELDNKQELLNMSEIKELIRLGFDIGCHTSTHPDLTKISGKQLEYEIVKAKKMLENKLGITIKYFAYPKGKYNDEIIEVVKRAGYIAAFTVNPGCISGNQNPYSLPRTIIDKTHTLSEFPAVYSPSTFLLRRVTNRYKLWEKFLSI